MAFRILFSLAPLLLCSVPTWVPDPVDAPALAPATSSSAETQQDQASVGSEGAPQEDRQELYKKLAEKLTGTRWTGHFTVSGRPLDDLRQEEYQILSAQKADEGEYWLLRVRIKYGDNDLTLPLPPLEILWAGRTPIITVDRLTVPGLGTFDARVVIRNDKYAGTWNHDGVGGHLFGKIEPLDDGETAEPPKQAEEKDKAGDGDGG